MIEARFVERVRAGDHAALARALTLVERGGPGASSLLAALAPHGGRALVIGVTGPPGAGKSTLVSQLVTAWRARGDRVAVLAVDPTSPFTGGAVLGDRVRMQGHATDAGVFIRSMATRGQLGGLAAATADAVRLLDAAGFDDVLVETVGVGQDEIAVVHVADVSIVTLGPGAGDEVQALKAGIMEAGDIFVVNKADLDGADRAVAAIETTLSLDARPPGAWHPPVVRTKATTGEGVPALLDAIARFRREAAAAIDQRRHDRAHVGRASSLVLDHVGIAVSDAAASLGFFRDVLGLAPDAGEVVGDQHARVRFLNTGGARLELVESIDETSSIARFLQRDGPGLHHIALRVADLTGTLARLADAGVRLVDRVPRRGAHGRWVAFVHPSSTHGVLVELVQEEQG